MNTVKLIKPFAAGFLGIVLLSCSLLYSQEIDPFYTKLLREGERQFQARNYKEAIKTLEIASFGLHQQRNLEGEAYVYLSLSHYYFKDFEKTGEYLRKAVGILGPAGIENLNIDRSARNDLYNLLSRFNLTPVQKPRTINTPPPKTRPQTQTTIQPVRPVKTTPKNRTSELQNRIKAEPQNIPLYYELYGLHRRNNYLNSAKKVLESLVEENLYEFEGLHFLGLINFQQRKYRDATKNFERVLTLSGKVPIQGFVLLDTKAYLILCFNNLRDTKKTQELANNSMDVFSGRKLSLLSLKPKDMDEFLQIIAPFKARITESDAMRIKNLEGEVKNEPRNIFNYFELFELHKKYKTENEARKVIQDLVLDNLDAVRGPYLLGKFEFIQKNYENSLRYFNQVLRPSDRSKVDNELLIKSLIYVSVSLYHLGRTKYLPPFIKAVEDYLTQDNLNRVLREEALKEEWEEIRALKSN
jgi:tetratricopeptide (TPR) repeat protein